MNPQETPNPFSVQTPEGMLAQEAVDLFVDVFTDFPKVPNEGHVFVEGPRGSGKSMMFRYLQPDCQRLVLNCEFQSLPFLGINVPVKNTSLRLTELRRLEEHHAASIINEHFMTMLFTERVFDTLSKQPFPDLGSETLRATQDFYSDCFIGLLNACGHRGDAPSPDDFENINHLMKCMHELADAEYRSVIPYLKKLTFSKEVFPYEGALCGYLDFLYPLLVGLKNLPYAPKGPLFLLVDDADSLSLTQTKILNTWVSSRTSSQVSIKVSSQLSYKTFRTLSGGLIESPHDYSEVNISTIYTGPVKAKYRDRVREIVSKRLKTLAGMTITPEEFFPENREQETAIRRIADEYVVKWETEGRGYRPIDDAYRYARPDYIKGLGGQSKSTPTYSYAGFNQLVHVSSGVIRYFLEASAMMFSETRTRTKDGIVSSIPPAIQNQVVRRQAADIMLGDFEMMRSDRDEQQRPPLDDIDRLENLIKALGGTFYRILISDRSERRVFSIAISGQLEESVRRILRLGTERGYFHMSSIGNKDGTGRTPLFILNRQLAPYFNLDPSGFAGYLFVTCEALRIAMSDPDALLRRIKEDGNADDLWEMRQLSLFKGAEA